MLLLLTSLRTTCHQNVVLKDAAGHWAMGSWSHAARRGEEFPFRSQVLSEYQILHRRESLRSRAAKNLMAFGNWAAWPHPTSFSLLLLSLTHRASAPSKMHCLPQSSLLSFSYSFPHPRGPSSYLTCLGKGWNILSPALPFGLYFPEHLVSALVISLPGWHDSGTAG